MYKECDGKIRKYNKGGNMAGNYRLKIAYGDRQFEAEGDKKFVLDMWAKFQEKVPQIKEMPAERKIQEKSSEQTSFTSRSGKALSVGEFIRQMGLKKHTEFVLAFGYYLEKYTGMREFGPADINKCYYDSKMDSSNTSQMLIQNIKQGRIMEAKGTKKKGQKQYTLTQTGEEFIEKALTKKKAV
jgi:predicted transcriptional regulator